MPIKQFTQFAVMFKIVWYKVVSLLNMVMYISIFSHFMYELGEALSKVEPEIMKPLFVDIK